MFKAMVLEETAWQHISSGKVYGVVNVCMVQDPWRGYFALVGVIPDDGKRHLPIYYCEDAFLKEFKLYGKFSQSIEMAI